MQNVCKDYDETKSKAENGAGNNDDYEKWKFIFIPEEPDLLQTKCGDDDDSENEDEDYDYDDNI